MEKKKISLKEIGLPKLIMLLLAGILLIFLSVPSLFDKEETVPNNNIELQEKDGNTTSYGPNNYITTMEQKLENILKKVNGIGDVNVMITLKGTGEQVTLKDIPYTQESLNEVDGEGGSRTDSRVKREDSTVLIDNGSGKTEPYIIQELEPEVEGVVVVAEGGDNSRIIQDIMEAAEVLFGVPAHKVKVMKMNE